MNLWRRSKAWFQDSSISSEKNLDHSIQPSLQEEKDFLHQNYENEKKVIVENCRRQLMEVKLRFDAEFQRLESKIRSKANLEGGGSDASEVPESDDGSYVGEVVLPLKQTFAADNDHDGLEWDFSDDLRSYENEVDDSCWEVESEGLVEQGGRGSCLCNGVPFDDTESSDSACSCSSLDPGMALRLEEGSSLGFRRRRSEVEREMEHLRLTIRREVSQECEKKFLKEKNFLYSMIDELEETVSLLRKQKEDIVKIFEREGREGDVNEAKLVVENESLAC